MEIEKKFLTPNKYSRPGIKLEKVTKMVPIGGGGIGMHVIPVEKAIPAEQKSESYEHLSHWIEKYDGNL